MRLNCKGQTANRSYRFSIKVRKYNDLAIGKCYKAIKALPKEVSQHIYWLSGQLLENTMI